MFRRLATKKGLLFRVEGQDWLTRRVCTVKDDEFMLQVFETESYERRLLLVEKLKEL